MRTMVRPWFRLCLGMRRALGPGRPSDFGLWPQWPAGPLCLVGLSHPRPEAPRSGLEGRSRRLRRRFLKHPSRSFAVQKAPQDEGLGPGLRRDCGLPPLEESVVMTLASGAISVNWHSRGYSAFVDLRNSIFWPRLGSVVPGGRPRSHRGRQGYGRRELDHHPRCARAGGAAEPHGCSITGEAPISS